MVGIVILGTTWRNKLADEDQVRVVYLMAHRMNIELDDGRGVDRLSVCFDVGVLLVLSCYGCKVLL